MYMRIIKHIEQACMTAYKQSKTLVHSVDGRLNSANHEYLYLDALSSSLRDEEVVIPASRHWYDIKINSIPFNLKLTTGRSTDNIFNKKAIAFSLNGSYDDIEKIKYNTFDNWYKDMMAMNHKPMRDKTSEYHFIVVNKITGQILIKSIFDILSYRSNPSNILQVKWSFEFKFPDVFTPDHDIKQKQISLLKTIQKSVRDCNASRMEFCNSNISW